MRGPGLIGFLFAFTLWGCATSAPALKRPPVHVHFSVHGLLEESAEAIGEVTTAVGALPGVESVHFQTESGIFGVGARAPLDSLLGPLVSTVGNLGERTGREYHLVWGGKPQGLNRLPDPVWKGSFKTLKGETVILEDVVGAGPALVTFWATWCAACLTESVYLQSFFETYGDGVQFLAFSVNPVEEVEILERFTTATGLTYPVVLDPGGAFLDTLGVEALPYTLVFNAKGELLYRENTFREAEVGLLEEALIRARGRPAP